MEPTADSSTPLLVQETVLLLIAEDGPGCLIPTQLRYDCSDPYAVTLVAAGHDGPVEWCFARELLVDGLIEPSGAGDVHVWPGATDDGCPALFLELVAGDAEAVLAALPCDIRVFLANSQELVAPGDESEHCDVDAIITAIFSAVSNGPSGE